jgi:hypothetical protein
MLRQVAAFFVVIFLCGLAAMTAYADSEVRIVRLSYTEGEVEIDRNAGQGFEMALMNLPITHGARLETGPDGHAEVEFENGSTVRLAPATRFIFRELFLRSSGEKVSLIELASGTAYFNLRPKDHNVFRLLIGGHEVPVEDSVRLRASAYPTETKLAVLKGKLEFQAGTQSVKVKKNQTADLSGGQYLVSKGVQQEAFDDWDEDREEYLERYASGTYFDSPYRYGYSDLNYYGNFVNVPGYGYVWRPYSVGLGWDPFLDGAWAYYPGAGYVWVSRHPWGWTPYRYGSWVHVPAYGWCWRPGRHWHRWTPVPPVSRGPAAFVPPKPPTAPGATVMVGRPGALHKPYLEPRQRDLRTRNPRPGTTVVPAPAVKPQPRPAPHWRKHGDDGFEPGSRHERRMSPPPPARPAPAAPAVRTAPPPRPAPAAPAVRTAPPPRPAPRMSPKMHPERDQRVTARP